MIASVCWIVPGGSAPGDCSVGALQKRVALCLASHCEQSITQPLRFCGKFFEARKRARALSLAAEDSRN